MTWTFKANLRGPAGYNATGAAEDDAAIAAFVEEESGVTATGTALHGIFARKDSVATNVANFGAIGDGVADDRVALQAALDSGKALYWGGPDKEYRITDLLQVTLTSNLVWSADGARIVLDRATSLPFAIQVLSAGFDVYIDGPLTLDCAKKAFSGFYFFSDSTTRANFTAKGLAVRNAYRESTTYTGGDGILVRGSYNNVFLERPDVQNTSMAAGAGVVGVQGVSGITITSAGAGLAPGEITILHPYIEGVYCEDPAYMFDQDGIRIFTEQDDGTLILFDTHFTILGGTIKNSRGRGVKSQCEFGVIDGTKFVRDSAQRPEIAGQATMPEIDFQVGGGLVTNVECRYSGSTPNRVIQWTGTRQVGGRASTGLSVRGFKVSYTGSTTSLIENFITVTAAEQLRPSINLSDIEIYNPSYFLNGNFMEASGTVSTELFARLTNISANLNTGAYAFYRTGTATLVCFVSIANFVKTRTGNGNFSGAATAGSLTVITSGQNVRMV